MTKTSPEFKIRWRSQPVHSKYLLNEKNSRNQEGLFINQDNADNAYDTRNQDERGTRDGDILTQKAISKSSRCCTYYLFIYIIFIGLCLF